MTLEPLFPPCALASACLIVEAVLVLHHLTVMRIRPGVDSEFVTPANASNDDRRWMTQLKYTFWKSCIVVEMAFQRWRNPNTLTFNITYARQSPLNVISLPGYTPGQEFATEAISTVLKVILVLVGVSAGLAAVVLWFYAPKLRMQMQRLPKEATPETGPLAEAGSPPRSPGPSPPASESGEEQLPRPPKNRRRPRWWPKWYKPIQSDSDNVSFVVHNRKTTMH